MRIAINLATRPFVELRPLFARLRLVMTALALVALGLGFWLHNLNERSKEAGAQMDALVAQTHDYQAERARNEAKMTQPQNRGVLERSRFLNALFANKSFSWTAVMMDLERVLPAGVQVTSIDPVISKEGDVTIRLRVTGDRDRTIQLVHNLERSQRFIAPRIANETSLTKERASALSGGVALNVSAPVGSNALGASLGAALGSGVEFEIFSGYNPLPDRPAKIVSNDTVDDNGIEQIHVVHDRHATTGPMLAPAQEPTGGRRRRPVPAQPKGAKR